MKNISIIAFIIALLFQVITTHAQDLVEGEKIFNSTCKACHSVGKGKIVGPDLINILERRDEEWLQKFIKSPKQMIQSKDPYAVKLFEENDKILMPDHALKDTDIKNILSFIQDQGKVAIASEPKPETKAENKPVVAKAKITPELSAKDYFIYSLVAVCFILISIILILLFQIFKVVMKK